MELRRRALLSGAVASVPLASGCASLLDNEEPRTEAFSLSSEGIVDDGLETVIKYEHTKQGENVSPPVRLHNVPASRDHVVVTMRDVTGAREIPLWLLWGRIPPENRVPEGLAKTGHPENLTMITQGTNASGEVGYSGPDLTREYEDRDGGNDTVSVELTAYVSESELDLPPESDYGDVIDALNDRSRTSTSLSSRVATGPESELRG